MNGASSPGHFSSKETKDKAYASHPLREAVTLAEAKKWFAPQPVLLFSSQDTEGKSVDWFIENRNHDGELEAVVSPPPMSPFTATEGELLAGGAFVFRQSEAGTNLSYAMPGNKTVVVRNYPGEQFEAMTTSGANACHVTWTERGKDGKFLVYFFRGPARSCGDGTLLAVANRMS